MKKHTAEDLIKVGTHLGHKKHKIHPRSKQYIHKIESGVSIIDLYKTADLLNLACRHLYELGTENKDILIVATKKNARPIITSLCQDNTIPFLTNKWVGGFLTNFEEIHKNVERLEEMRESKKAGEWSKYVKHEQILMEKKLNRIAVIYDGVLALKEKPKAIVIIDVKKEQNAVKEAGMMGVSSIAMTDTNCDPSLVDYPIPSNDDSVHAIEYIARALIDSYLLGRKKAKPDQGEKSKKKEPTQ